MYLMSEGEVLRYREESGVEHQVDISPGGLEQAPIKAASPSRNLKNRTVDSSSPSSVSTRRIVAQVDPNQHLATINSMHYLRGDPAYSSAVCTSTICKAYALSQSQFLDTLSTRPPLAAEIITSLQKEVREQKNALRTPFLELKNRKDINIPAVSVAAAIESYYRSALNAMLNARLLGTKAAFFPNMHVQVIMAFSQRNRSRIPRPRPSALAAWINIDTSLYRECRNSKDSRRLETSLFSHCGGVSS
mmetsp:Transcript_2348/g.9890  ORF Transcript_2348/g.9890 Transcript_2348/m.9890 type:complete len:247 (-) Transcript_2348:2711-3451(-)